MRHDELEALADKLEAATTGDPEAVYEVMRGLATAFPGDAGTPALDARVLVSSEAALELVGRKLPQWQVALEGTAQIPYGDWRCTLRESGTRDDDELIGVAEARTLPLALLAALLRVAARQARRRP